MTDDEVREMLMEMDKPALISELIGMSHQKDVLQKLVVELREKVEGMRGLVINAKGRVEQPMNEDVYRETLKGLKEQNRVLEKSAQTSTEYTSTALAKLDEAQGVIKRLMEGRTI